MATKSMKVGAAVLGGVLVVGIAVVAGRRSVDSPKKAAKALATTTTSTAPPSGALVEFRDEKAGWAISYPKDWNRLQSKDPDVALVVSEKPPDLNTGGLMHGRTPGVPPPGGASESPGAKTGAIESAASGPGGQVLDTPAPDPQGGRAAA